MKFLKNIIIKKTKEEKIHDYGNYLCACLVCGEITGKEASQDLLYYTETLNN